MYLTAVRAGIIGMLLIMSLTSSLFAYSQTLFPSTDDRSKVPKAELARKTSFAFKASELYLAGGTAFDMTTTVQGLSHPTAAYRSDKIFLTHYYVVESGWAGVFGKRNAFTAVGANVFLNVGIDRFSHRLYARGGRWRALAFGTILMKGTFNVIAAGNNIRNDERINHRVRLATGYRGQILWFH